MTLDPEIPTARPFVAPTQNLGDDPLRRGVVYPHRGMALLVTALVGITLSPFLASPIAWYFANVDLASMANGTMDSQGVGVTRLARALAVAGTILGVIIVIYIVFAVTTVLVATSRPQFRF